MEKSIALGPETTAKMGFSAGKARIELAYAGKQATAGMFVEMTAKEYLDMLKAAIPGEVDDYIINALEAAMTIVP